MKTVKIFLRSLEQKERIRLALFDTNRNGAIDDLITEVPPQATIIWKPDKLSGIGNITRIYSKTGKRNVFKTDPTKKLLCKAFKLRLDKDAEGEEAYAIEFTLCNGKKITIDPYIRIKPPE